MITKHEMDEFVEVNGIRVLPQFSIEADTAIYITPEGNFLSGRSQDAVRVGELNRDIDHICVSWIMDTNPYMSNTFWTDMFKKTGFVMVVPENKEYYIVEPPTKAQEASCRWLQQFGFVKGQRFR